MLWIPSHSQSCVGCSQVLLCYSPGTQLALCSGDWTFPRVPSQSVWDRERERETTGVGECGSNTQEPLTTQKERRVWRTQWASRSAPSSRNVSLSLRHLVSFPASRGGNVCWGNSAGWGRDGCSPGIPPHRAGPGSLPCLGPMPGVARPKNTHTRARARTRTRTHTQSKVLESELACVLRQNRRPESGTTLGTFTGTSIGCIEHLVVILVIGCARAHLPVNVIPYRAAGGRAQVLVDLQARSEHHHQSPAQPHLLLHLLQPVWRTRN